jgi:hypothetical protein
MTSPLATAIEFFKNFGLFDIVLPFLLVFAVVFAILEKTMILGKENDKPKKNINSMVAFVIALLVVSTNKIVSVLNEALPNIVLLIFVLICFLMLLGTLLGSGELDLMQKHKGWYTVFLIIIFIAIIVIFMSAIKLESGQSWLGYIYEYIVQNWGGAVVSSFIFLAVIVGTIIWVTYSKKGGNE